MLDTRCYRINGIVQGVGFRPHVHRLAIDNSLNGWVLNDSEGVLIEVQGKTEELENFIFHLSKNPPPLSKITNIIPKEITDSATIYTNFLISKSVSGNDTKTIVPPDSFVCSDCLREMRDSENRRYCYPFINCTNCGPRYSIIEKMPYDRPMTTMKAFTMCDKCEAEYHDIEDRRYHAQPNACPICGPSLIYTDNKGNKIESNNIVSQAIQHLKEGKVLAVKSLGGFHLAVDARNEQAVNTLRKRKRRDSKPFALMVENLDIARNYGVVGEKDALLLESPQRPIVLLKKKDGTLPETVAPFNPNFGIMLPSAPLHHLLLETCELLVLIMTSANISGYPIVFKNETALCQLSQIADYFLMNNRDIHTPVDDSLVRNSVSLSGEEVTTFIRRSRGYAPYPVTLKTELRSIIALGSELKNVIAISKGKEVYLSQHIGDLKNAEIFDSMRLCSSKMENLFDINPEAIAIDMHPQFKTAKKFKELDKPVFKIQHHHAHMASCMAENNLSKPVIGVIFDGTGYGTDATIWGGEFLCGDYNSFNRTGHIYPFYLLGGDKAVKEPIRTAISLLYTAYGEDAADLCLPMFEALTDEEKRVFFKMAEKKINSFKTTSMGRLFDGISSLVGVCHRIEYEAQAAIELEGLLNRDLIDSMPLEYSIINNNGNYILDHRPMIRHIVRLIIEGRTESSELSRKFHSTIVKASAEICRNISNDTGINNVVFSGGVFMNEYILCNMITEFKKNGLKVHYQQTVPSNDGGIALGQLAIANAQLKIGLKKKEHLNNTKASYNPNDKNDAVKYYLNNIESNARTYSRVFDTVFVSGKGSMLKDINGKSYIDCLSGAGTLATGHNHPNIISKLKEALETDQILHALDLSTLVREEYIGKIFSCLPEKFRNKAKIQFCGPTGADAVEASIKLFKTATKRRTIIAFHGAYHGMTAGSLSLTGNLNAKNNVPSLMPDVHFLPYPYQYRCPYGVGGDTTVKVSLRHIRQVLTDPESGITKPAAIYLEVVQGEGGCIPAPVRWLQGIREITSELDIPLVIDEIQTGFGRTGFMFAFEEADIVPDAVLLSKAAGGGLPISLLVYREKYDKWAPGAHAGTFRGNQLAMIAGIETINIIHRERLVEQSKLKGELTMNFLNNLKKKYSCIGDVRGKGLLIGIEIIDTNGLEDEFGVKPADSERTYNIKKECFKNGLIIESGGRHSSVLRLLPALNISEGVLQKAFDIFSKAIEATENS